MKLRFKLILLLFGFGFVMLAAMEWSNHYLLHNTMVKYVDQRDQQRLERLKHNIEVYLDEKGGASIDEVSREVWQRLLTASHRVDLTQTYIPLDLLLTRPYPKMLKIHPDEFESRVSLLDEDGLRLFGPSPTKNGMVECIRVDGEDVGHLGYNHRKALTEKGDIEFTQNQSLIFTWGALLVSFLAIILLIPFASHFLTPIQNVTQGMRKLSQGVFSTRLTHNRKDELGQLQQDFNHLASSLEKSRQSRNQWIADISHELRTPLTVLRGSLEAIKDGVRPPNEHNIKQIHDEVILMNRLVDDLYQVALNDIGGLDYKMVRVDLVDLVHHCAEAYEDALQEKGLQLVTNFPSKPVFLNADETRLQQMVGNLLANSIAYTDTVQPVTGEQGQIRLSVGNTAKEAWVTIEDTAPTVSMEEIGHLFERLYRTEMSRNRRKGGAGLGLAIVQQIVEAHRGQIEASQSELGGVSIKVSFPL